MTAQARWAESLRINAARAAPVWSFIARLFHSEISLRNCRGYIYMYVYICMVASAPRRVKSRRLRRTSVCLQRLLTLQCNRSPALVLHFAHPRPLQTAAPPARGRGRCAAGGGLAPIARTGGDRRGPGGGPIRNPAAAIASSSGLLGDDRDCWDYRE